MPITLPYPVEEDTFYKRGHRKGLRKGLEAGHRKGLETGHLKGLNEGERLGLENEKIQTVLRMFKKGYDIQEIASISDLSLKEVNDILKKLKSQ